MSQDGLMNTQQARDARTAIQLRDAGLFAALNKLPKGRLIATTERLLAAVRAVNELMNTRKPDDRPDPHLSRAVRRLLQVCGADVQWLHGGPSHQRLGLSHEIPALAL